MVDMHVMEQCMPYKANDGPCKTVSSFNVANDIVQKPNKKQSREGWALMLFRT